MFCKIISLYKDFQRGKDISVSWVSSRGLSKYSLPLDHSSHPTYPHPHPPNGAYSLGISHQGQQKAQCRKKDAATRRQASALAAPAPQNWNTPAPPACRARPVNRVASRLRARADRRCSSIKAGGRRRDTPQLLQERSRARRGRHLHLRMRLTRTSPYMRGEGRLFVLVFTYFCHLFYLLGKNGGWWGRKDKKTEWSCAKVVAQQAKRNTGRTHAQH